MDLIAAEKATGQITKILNDVAPELRKANLAINTNQTDYKGQLLTLTHGAFSPHAYLKQCWLEINAKQNALRDVYYNLKKKKKRIEKWIEKGDELSMIKAEQAHAEIASLESSVHHAVREIDMFRNAAKEIQETHNIPDDWGMKDYAEHEPIEHIKRGFTMALKDMQSTGMLSSGTTDYIINCGIHPIAAKKFLVDYINDANSLITEGKVPSVTHFYDFLDRMVEVFQDEYKQVQAHIGIKQLHRD